MWISRRGSLSFTAEVEWQRPQDMARRCRMISEAEVLALRSYTATAVIVCVRGRGR